MLSFLMICEIQGFLREKRSASDPSLAISLSLLPTNPVHQFEPAHLPLPHELHPLQDPLKTLPIKIDLLRMRDQSPLGEQLLSNLPELRDRAVGLGLGFGGLAEHGVSFAYAGVGVDELVKKSVGLARQMGGKQSRVIERGFWIVGVEGIRRW
jgi:hypothetical protein